jgi:hypothetical protein
MSDHKTRVRIAIDPCVACGCHLVSTFECNCGEVHGDYCENCGGFLGIPHASIEDQNGGIGMWWAGRCTAGAIDHVHECPFKPWPKEST